LSDWSDSIGAALVKQQGLQKQGVTGGVGKKIFYFFPGRPCFFFFVWYLK
jgi:hypothetical protein